MAVQKAIARLFARVRGPIWKLVTPLAAQSITQCSTVAHHDAVIRVYDEAGSVIETHEHKGDFREC